MNALELFRIKKLDYIQIGEALGISESEVEKTIHQLRIEERARKSERQKLAVFPIAYAGEERRMPTEWRR